MNNINLGFQRDGRTVAANPIQDTFYASNPEMYYTIGDISTFISASAIPIGRAGNLALGAGTSPIRAMSFEAGKIYVSGIAAEKGSEWIYSQYDSKIGAVFGGLAMGGLTYGGLTGIDKVANVSGIYRTSGVSGIDKGDNVFKERMANKGGVNTWKVDPAMQVADEASGVLKNGVYAKNPTAQNINGFVKEGSNYLGSKTMNGQYMYVVDTQGNIVIGTRGGQHMPHPTLIGGSNPQVKAAGIVEIRGGKIYKIDNASGHFKPGAGSLDAAKDAFNNLPSNVFSKDFQGYVPFEN